MLVLCYFCSGSYLWSVPRGTKSSWRGGGSEENLEIISKKLCFLVDFGIVRPVKILKMFLFPIKKKQMGEGGREVKMTLDHACI